jgi:hypothetical protein
VTSVISGDLSSEAFSGHVTFLPVVNKSLGTSWPLSDVQDGPAVDLATTANGTWESLDGSQPYGGASDLSGKVWLRVRVGAGHADAQVVGELAETGRVGGGVVRLHGPVADLGEPGQRAVAVGGDLVPEGVELNAQGFGHRSEAS